MALIDLSNVTLPIARGLKESYIAKVKNPDVMYIIEDTGEIYIGNKLIASKGGDFVGISDVEINENTFVLTFTYSDGTTKEFDLPLESVFADVEYDPQTHIITFELVNGEKTTANLSDLIPATVSEITEETDEDAIPTVGAVVGLLENVLAIGTF